VERSNYFVTERGLDSGKVKNTRRPETIENRWDILYRDYPEVYDEFASVLHSKRWIDIARKVFSFKNKTIADIGSGSGQSTFELAKFAKLVVGIEPEDSMRKLAIKNARDRKLPNVRFKKGWAENIPLEDNSVDMTVAVTAASFYDADNIRKFASEAERITKKGGYVASVEVAPKWYGGELASVILGKSRKIDTDYLKDATFTELGFEHRDYYSIQDYQTVSKAVKTYGFIFGRKAIEYLQKHNKTTIKWKFRIYYRRK